MATKRAKKNKQSKTKSSSGDDSIGLAILASAFAAAGLVAAFALVWYLVILAPNQGDEVLKREEVLNQYTQLFNGRIAELRTQVGTMAQASQTLDAMTDPDGQARILHGELLASQHPFILRVDLIERGGAEVDLNNEVPISFAALDLIRRAETREFVGPEVSLNQRNLIYAAQPITPDGMIAGVLLVVFDSQFFLNPLSHFEATQGTFKIEQTFAGNPSTEVMQWGRGGSEALKIEAQLFAPHWALIFEAHPDLLPDKVSLGTLLIPLLVAIGLVVAVIFTCFVMYGGRIRRDADLLADIAVRVARGRTVRIAGFNLGVLEQVATTLEPYAKTAQRDEEPVDEVADESEEEKKPSPKASEIADDEFLEVTNVGNRDNFGIEVSEESGPMAMGLDLDPEIFRAYDIRGITTKNLTEDIVYWIGRAFAAEALAAGQPRAAVGWDGRHSSEPLRESLTRGLSEEGMEVITVGQVPTPLLYYATHALETGTGIMITGSHNPPEYNGLKMMIGGVTLAEERIQNIYQRLINNQLNEDATPGEIEAVDLDDSYIDKIVDDIAVAQPPKVVVDCGNGVAGKLAPRLLEELGCEVVPLYCDIDGDFPNHHPDPAEPENLADLITVVQAEKADIGLAFDGDGDRVGVVTSSGEIIWPDKLIMLFAQDIVSRNPGADIIYDVKCSRHLNTIISELGGRPIMWKTGHSHIKAKIKETGALLGGEFSGHICFAERWYGFDDALYSAARLLEIVGSGGETVDGLFAQFPVTFTTPELKVTTTDSEKFEIMGRLEVEADWAGGALTTIDGIRVDFDDGWGLIRPSNTSPVLSLRFEADGPAALERIQELFAGQLAAIDPNLSFR
ncbi:MAG: phosphomannomutase/phosphoglucomutase [Pseudomonadales bacterium]|nr:phosphomannomutase/phosphoglucomutase [Pseudomonadales bacterium]